MLAKAGEPHEHIFGAALELASGMSDEEHRSSSLSDIASGLAKAGEFERASELVRRIRDECGRNYGSDALSDIASELAKAGEFDAALRTVKSADGDWGRIPALRDIAVELAKANEFDEALELAREISDKKDRASTLIQIASVLAARTTKATRVEHDTKQADMEKLEAHVIKLTDLAKYQEGSVVSRTPIDKSTGTVTLFAFDEGQGLNVLTAPSDALVHVRW